VPQERQRLPRRVGSEPVVNQPSTAGIALFEGVIAEV
jgi:hypothetical protein